ncbi:hypothetical protein KGM_201206 [Danaus plexippus plexippus]|uniref:Uncharacterized protein n=1 Tax=Danaus plexippus plexippus TaxID=278856 RepID=A0A212FPF9_DANPL|nr:hypothetical protein KGM_201206 [Danaus plexippus plexippus]
MVMTIDPSLYVHIKNETTVHNLWAKLKSLFDDSGFTRRISLLRTLISIRLDSSESMTANVTQVVDTAQKLKGTGLLLGHLTFAYGTVELMHFTTSSIHGHNGASFK